MKIICAGVGNAFTTRDYYQSSFVVEINQKRLLIDCGGDSRFSLGELGVTAANLGNWLDAIYISHLHSDHCGGLEFAAFCTYFTKSPKPKLFIRKDLTNDLWTVMKTGLNSLKAEKVSLKTYFDMNPVQDSFDWQGVNFRLVKGWHVWANNVLMPVYGLVFNGVYFSADTVRCDATIAECRREGVKLILHDCETLPYKSGVHAHYDDLRDKFSDDVRKKMWLYHYAPDPKQDAKADGFAGFARKGQIFEV